MSREDEIQDKVEDFRMGLIEPWEFANKMRHEVPWLLKELKRADAENARLRRELESRAGNQIDGVCERIAESVLRGNQVDCDPQ